MSPRTKGFTKDRIKVEFVLKRLACDSHSRGTHADKSYAMMRKLKDSSKTKQGGHRNSRNHNMTNTFSQTAVLTTN
jgi:hypothetical protein